MSSAPDPDHAQEEWLHALYNAVNALGVSITVARRLLAEGEHARAADLLANAESSCERVRRLSRDPPALP